MSLQTAIPDRKGSSTHRLEAIEGLRGYLAIFVMISHIFIFGAYIHIPEYFHTEMGGLLSVLDNGVLAVNCFMIISGFVIFMLIDRKQEPYLIYIVRRILRIFPVYFFLLILAIPSLWLSGISLGLTSGLQSQEAIQATQLTYKCLWENIWFHFPLHLTMLHGLVPANILPNASTAFLGPAWSLSLEWQFYIIAPLWYALFITKNAWRKQLMYGGCLFCILKSHYFFSQIEQGAFLPLQLSYFLAGIASYFLYKNIRHLEYKGDIVLPLTMLLLLGIYRIADKALGLAPFMIWAVVLTLLFEPEHSISSKLISPIFTNRVSLWLGKISYSIYLSHSLVLALVQYLTLKLLPHSTKTELLVMLLLATTAITLPFSEFLYQTIERPFILYGKRILSEKQDGL